MNQEAHRSIDVDVFKEILENDFFHKEQNKEDDILSLVQKINSAELKFIGLESDAKKEVAKLKFKQFGFRLKNDLKVDVKTNVSENKTIITLIPQKVYELEEVIKKLPLPNCENGKKLNLLLGDSFERLKVKTKNILQNSSCDDQIIHYAKKNIQIAKRNCYEARILLVKMQKTKNREAIFLVFIVNVFMINVISYLLKMFSSYYKDDSNENNKQKAELYDIIDFNLMMEPEIEYKKKQEINDGLSLLKLPYIKLNVQTNQFLTAVYDILNYKNEENINIIETDQKELEELISKIFIDRKGNLLKKSTINTCLKPSREEKRVTGNKKIDVLKYFESKK